MRDRLRAIPGVEEAFLDGEHIWIVCGASSAGAVADGARALLRDEAPEAASVPIRVLVQADSRERERVRFERVDRTEDPDMRVRYRVVLEWNGERIDGIATGEKGDVPELRTTAIAALAAIERVIEGPLEVRLAGVKLVRAFDTDLMVVSLFRSDDVKQKYLGTVLVGTDPKRAAALAVLHALNRTLGNYLVTR
ncbi:MAG: hypothetical protein ACREL7_01570 [Longimicrobiales bacterium]